MKRALFFLVLFIILPSVATALVYEFAEMQAAPDLSARDTNVPAIKADRDFYMMSQTEHLAKARQLCNGNASKEQLFLARHHLVSISIGTPEYAEAISLLGQIEKTIRH